MMERMKLAALTKDAMAMLLMIDAFTVRRLTCFMYYKLLYNIVRLSYTTTCCTFLKKSCQ